jgi:D-3-phosphoglycerate dehydrogenase
MVPQMDNALHKGVWQKKIGIQLEGKTVAIIGFGRIGHRVAELLSSFKVKILIVDPYLKDDVGDYTVISLEKALPQADIITIHCSGNECILGEKEFSLVKPNTYLLNSARGELISEEALKKALDNGLIAGVWLDTFNNEPYNGPLTQYPQIVLTPHISSYTYECRKQMETEAVDNLINALIKIKADNL